MKKFWLVAVILFGLFGAAQAGELDNCNFVEKDRAVMDSFFKTGKYKNSKSGILCYREKEGSGSIVYFIFIKRGIAAGISKAFYFQEDQDPILVHNVIFKDGIKDGQFFENYINGNKKAEGFYYKNRINGTYKTYLEDGSLDLIIEFKQGKAVSGKCSNGKKLSKDLIDRLNDGEDVACSEN